ncbi:MAG: amidohydrolase family protein [Nitrospinota bacterium]
MPPSLVHGRHVVVDNETVLTDAAVFQADGKIESVGAYADLKSRYPGAAEVGGRDCVVLPGLVNAHHHVGGVTAFQSGWRDDPLEIWLLNFFGARMADPYDLTLLSFIQLIRSGVTTVLHHHTATGERGYRPMVEAQLRAAQDSGIRCSFAMCVQDRHHYVYENDEAFLQSLPVELREEILSHEMIDPQGSSGGSLPADEYFSLFESLFRQHAGGGPDRLRLLLGPKGVEWCSDALLQRVRRTADALGTGVHTHVLESPYEKLFGLRTFGVPTVCHLREIGFLGPALSCAHCVWLTDREIELFAETATTAVHNPSSNLRLASGIAPVNRMRAAGGNVALGMDAFALNDDEDFWQEMRLALRLHREPGLDTPRPSAGDVLQMATSNGARAALWGEDVGTLHRGQKADMVLLQWPSVRGIYLAPETPILDAILSRAKAAYVDTVLVDGEVLVAGGRYLRHDEAQLAERLAVQMSSPEDPQRVRLRAIRERLRPLVEAYYRGWTLDLPPGGYAYNARE